MALRVALHHSTTYSYARPIAIFPQIVRLRPAPHCRTPIVSYSLKIEPAGHFINWQQDPQGNYQARLVFPEKSAKFQITVDLVAEMTVINPFDFFLEKSIEHFPWTYEPWLATELRPFLEQIENGPLLREYVSTVDITPARTIDFLVALNQRVKHDIQYTIRLEPGVQTCEETLQLRSGSCRDTAWLLVQILRKLGIAARFVSGYLIQLVADVQPLDGPAGPTQDFTDLHAWVEVYLPGAGWVGLDPTSGLLAGEGHIPLACTPDPQSAAPVTGAVEPCESTFDFAMHLTRVLETPRVTKPYSPEQWSAIEALGHQIDVDLERQAVRLTMGGEPTFVSIDDMEGAEWNTAALGPTKRILAGELIKKLRARFASGGLLHYGQGKWYPGEQLPRWALSCYWRRDGQPIWKNPDLLVDEDRDYNHTAADAQRFGAALARRLGVGDEYLQAGYEDSWYYLWRERRLPVNVDPLDSKVEDKVERERIAKIFDQGLKAIVGYALPIERRLGAQGWQWASGPWFLRREHMFLIPGDSPMGFRLPLDSIPWALENERQYQGEFDPSAPRGTLPSHAQLAERRGPSWPQTGGFKAGRGLSLNEVAALQGLNSPYANGREDARRSKTTVKLVAGDAGQPMDMAELSAELDIEAEEQGGTAVLTTEAYLGNGGHGLSPTREHWRSWLDPRIARSPSATRQPQMGESAAWITRTAMCFETREGRLHVFMPPLQLVEDYLALITAIEETAAELDLPVVIEGYHPPHDYRLTHLRVTPDPGVIEVNLQPAYNWDELVKNTVGLYEDARACRLGTDKFMVDGRHTGTGGGNHVVMGGPTPAESPFLRRPDLLRSILTYWNNHPSLSYLFSGTFIGPTSQAPRIDEARHEQLYELEIAFQQIPANGSCPPWLTDRLFRNLLTDLTGNTHRAEFCIDKLYSPDTSSGRLGLVEFRAFEMPPHAQMSLAQQLLLRALVAVFWRQPYQQKLVHWGTTLHDKFMLPYFVWQDFRDVIRDLQSAGYPLSWDWFAPHFEFRFPRLGQVVYDSIELDFRGAIEPWLVLGEEPGGGGTVRYVDSSLERLQVHVRGLTDTRHVLLCNRRRVPLHPTGVAGEYIAGVRYRAWCPPSCLHPTIGVHTPLVFDLYDQWTQRSLGGATWHVMHPGGLSYDNFPINANAAETRRNSRFQPFGHSTGPWALPLPQTNGKFPFTLDLRYQGE
ncbi:MAG: transglutaminase family protein [Pirellulales bacterium]|nr:transglutaminase family protein [Pirellulales bacterium]